MDATGATSELARMGEILGEFRFAQGPGGNVSVKTATELWVKASGVRLRDVAKDAGHSRVALELAARALAGDADADARLFAGVPRPSLETYFHALPGCVVAHTHALGALLYACAMPSSARPEGVTGEVDYARPGRGVAVAMKAVINEEDEQAIILSSHGIVVIAPTAERAIARTVRIDDVVRARFGKLPSETALVAQYMQSQSCAVGGGVTRALPNRASPGRYLFPDVIICASSVLVDDLSDPEMIATRSIIDTRGRAHVLTDPAGNRVLVAKSGSQLDQSTEVIAAHDWLEDVLRAHATPKYLPADEPARLLELPSEQYRIQLAGTQS